MFAKVIDAIQGGPETDSDEELNAPEDEASDSASAQPASSGAFSFWQIAASVADTVKKGTADIAEAVQTTDWRAELKAFGNDVLEETEELSHTAASAVEQAVVTVEHLPQHASEALPVLAERQKAVQAQLGHVGHHLNRFGAGFVSGTHDLFEQVRDAIQTELAQAGEATSGGRSRWQPRGAAARGGGGGSAAKYSRLEAEVAAMQRDSGTYCDEPADAEQYQEWLKTFDLEAREAEIASIVADNTFMAELQSRIVPLIVEHRVFWTRYFYRLHLLQQKDAQRQQLAQRAQKMAVEEVGWGDEEEAAAPPAAAAAAETSAEPAAAPSTARDLAAQEVSHPPAETDIAAENAPASVQQTVNTLADSAGTATSPAAATQTTSGEADDANMASDSTDGGPGEQRWSVVGKKAAASDRSPEAGEESKSKADPIQEGDDSALSMPPTENAASGAAQASKQAEPAAAPVPKGPAGAGDEEAGSSDDDSLADVEVPEGGDGEGSEVDEDWGAWD